MGWISDRKMTCGHALYDDGPKRKGPLRRIVRLTVSQNDFFGCDEGWLECGHYSRYIYGREKAICVKCVSGAPKDAEGEDGWPVLHNAHLTGSLKPEKEGSHGERKCGGFKEPVKNVVRFRDMLKELAEAVETYDTSCKIHLVDVVKLAHAALAAIREAEEPNAPGEVALPGERKT